MPNKKYTFEVKVQDYYYAFDDRREKVITKRKKTISAHSPAAAREKLMSELELWGYNYTAKLIGVK